MRLEIQLLTYCGGRIKREAEMTSERVGTAKGKDANRRRRMKREPLDDLVKGAAASAGEDKVSAMADRIGRLCTGRSWAVGCDDLRLDAAIEKHVRGMLERAEARAAGASGVRVEDEGRARHALQVMRRDSATRLIGRWRRGRRGGRSRAVLMRSRNENRRPGHATMAGAAGDWILRLRVGQLGEVLRIDGTGHL